MKNKCKICNGCLESVWILPKRFFYCDFCEKYFDIIDGDLVEITKEVIEEFKNKQVMTR